MKIEKITLNEKHNVTLTAYIQEIGGEFPFITKRPAMLILPGGGYEMCSDREADPVAMPYLKAGYQVFILRYSVGEHAVWPNPLNDYEQAMTMIRNRAEEWHVFTDKIAVIGFSAGGHLAGAAAAMSKNRPNAAILGYAAVSEDIKVCLPSAPDVISYVDKDTCPCFLFASRSDRVVPVMNTVKMMEALTKAEVSYESHIYAYGLHGFSTNDHSVQYKDTMICERAKDWVEDSISWLREIFGDFGDGDMTNPECYAHVTSDEDEFLSINCTMEKILSNPIAAPLVEEVMANMMSAQSDHENEKQAQGKSGITLEEKNAHVLKMTLGDVLGFANTPRKIVNEFNDKLCHIQNLDYK